MSSSSSLSDRLATACFNGDIPSAKAAIADGASVNDKGEAPDWDGTVLPLVPAVLGKHYDVVVLLLSHGDDPNGDFVMACGAYCSTSAILQLLIDSGGDVNRNSAGQPPLFTAVGSSKGDVDARVRVLLAQPSLDLTAKLTNGKTAEQYARDRNKPALADMIAHEVRWWT